MGKNKLKTFLIIILGISLLAIGSLVFATNKSLSKIDIEALPKDTEEIGIPDIVSDIEGITNISLFGIDSRSSDFKGRSDSIIVLTIDKLNDKIKLSSFMRDSYVHIDGYGQDKLTHAYAYGGAQLAVKTLNQNFDLNIKDFATIDFAGLENIIDGLGGIKISIEQDEIKYINRYIKELSSLRGVEPPLIEEPGSYNLNGIQAVAYSRIRYTSGGDYKRTERQRLVLESIFYKVKSMGITKLPALIDDFLPYLKTSLSYADILKLGASVLSTDSSTLEQMRFPLDKHSKGGLIGKIWYLQYDEASTKEAISNYIFEDIKP